jgi:hypothetical protein
MALPQTVDPSTLNLSGKPTIATAPATTVTAPGGTLMQNPRIVDEKNEVSPLLGALFGGILGYAAQNRGAGTAQSANRPTTGQQGQQGTGGGLDVNLGGGTKPTGTTGSVVSKAINWDEPVPNNWVVSGYNIDVNGNAVKIITPDYTISPYTPSGNVTYPSQTADGSSSVGLDTSISGADDYQYYEDSSGNLYDANGDLIMAFLPGANIYVDPFGGSYDLDFSPIDTGSDYTSSDYSGDWWTPSWYDDFMGTPDYTDTSTYSPIDTTGGMFSSWFKNGGLATPLMRNGGKVKGYADGSTVTPTSFTDQVVANQVPTTTSATTATTDTSNTPSDFNLANFVSGLLSNKTLTGAGLGALLTQLINSGSTQPVNRGIDMTTFGALKPRTTSVGPARFVPYSEYGTPTGAYDYSTLYSNLGVSPFGSGAGTPAPVSPLATVPTTPTTPTGGLTPTTPTTPTTTPTTPSAPAYYSDTDGNIYDSSGNLVYIAETGETVTPSSSMADGGSVMTPSYYSYGKAVDPSNILGAKKGGLAVKKMADGGDLAVTSLTDAIEPVAVSAYSGFNPSGGVKYDADTGIATDVNGNTMTVDDFVGTYRTHPSNFTPDFYANLKYDYPEELIKDAQFDGKDYDFDKTTPLPYERVTTTDFTPVMYNQGMPTQGPAMPTQGALMPQQGSAMPQQTPFSDSPTFRYSGLNNPLLRGLSMTPTQPYTLAEGGAPHNKPFVPTTHDGRHDYRQGAYVNGEGDGQSDDIPAMLADGEYVIDAETVSQLGNGSNKAGAKVLDKFRENIRAHKRSAPVNKIPPKSKSALAYLKGAK